MLEIAISINNGLYIYIFFILGFSTLLNYQNIIAIKIFYNNCKIIHM